MKRHSRSPEARAKASAAMKAHARTPEFRARLAAVLARKPKTKLHYRRPT